MGASQTAWILRRAGWRYRKIAIREQEFWFLCTKEPRISCEGWDEEPLSNPVYEFERDLIKMWGTIDVDKYFELKENPSREYEEFLGAIYKGNS
jgi:hypothetical protein